MKVQVWVFATHVFSGGFMRRSLDVSLWAEHFVRCFRHSAGVPLLSMTCLDRYWQIISFMCVYPMWELGYICHTSYHYYMTNCVYISIMSSVPWHHIIFILHFKIVFMCVYVCHLHLQVIPVSCMLYLSLHMSELHILYLSSYMSELHIDVLFKSYTLYKQTWCMLLSNKHIMWWHWCLLLQSKAEEIVCFWRNGWRVLKQEETRRCAERVCKQIVTGCIMVWLLWSFFVKHIARCLHCILWT